MTNPLAEIPGQRDVLRWTDAHDARESSTSAGEATPSPAEGRPAATANLVGRAVDLPSLVLSLLAEVARSSLPVRSEELDAVASRVIALGQGGYERELLRYLAAGVQPRDAGYAKLRRELGLSLPELTAVVLTSLVEVDVLTGRLLARLQTPVGGSRPTLGFLLYLLQRAHPAATGIFSMLTSGVAFGSGLLERSEDGRPLVEQTLRVPTPLVLALERQIWRGSDRARTVGTPGYAFHDGESVPLPPSYQTQAQRYASAFDARRQCLVIRAGTALEGRTVAKAVADASSRRAVFVRLAEPSKRGALTGLGAWAVLDDLLPVFEREVDSLERLTLPPLPGYEGPTIALCGLEGSVEANAEEPLIWKLGVPSLPERRELWQRSLSQGEVSEEAKALAGRVARSGRHGVGRIASLGVLAKRRAAMHHRAVRDEDVTAAARESAALGLGSYAEALGNVGSSTELVVSRGTREELSLLLMRCGRREQLAEPLGASSLSRYCPGVRALFTGPSGTGKTLAVGWLAHELNAPLYRVDVASIVSKYIGETEKNLSQLLSRAEHAGVMLLFDEADSLFGKRTEVKQANDRFANMQTNYLLQRIESYEGLVILTSNGRDRFDSAFTRRLDAIIDFPKPAPPQRKELWLSHLGEHHDLSPKQLNQLAASVDLAGGHVRNVVFCAAALAGREGRKIAWGDVIVGLRVEYRKLGKPGPTGLG